MLDKKGNFGILGGHGPFGPSKSAYGINRPPISASISNFVILPSRTIVSVCCNSLQLWAT